MVQGAISAFVSCVMACSVTNMTDCRGGLTGCWDWISCYLWMEWSVDVSYIPLVNCMGWLCCCSLFSLVALTKDKNGVLKPPSSTTSGLILPFMPVSVYEIRSLQCSMYKYLQSYIIFINSSPFKYLMDLSLLNSFGLESTYQISESLYQLLHGFHWLGG